MEDFLLSHFIMGFNEVKQIKTSNVNAICFQCIR